MKLKTQNGEFTVNSFTGNGGVTVYVPLDTNLGELRSAVQTSDELSFYNVTDNGEEKLTATVTGKFVFKAVAVNDEHIKVVFSKTDNELARLGEAITDIELALVDIYESMGV